MPAPAPLAYAMLHPLHAILLAFPIALYSSALATDITYLNTAVVQWTHFSSWLIAAADLFAGLVLAWAAVMLFGRRSNGLRARAGLYFAAVAIMFIAGLVNAFQHSRDAWSSVMTLGLVLSIVCTLAALVAGWIGYSATNVREVAR